MPLIDGLRLTVTHRRDNAMHFTEIGYEWEEAGRTRYALTRLPYPISGDRHQLAVQRELFMKRNDYKELR